MKNMNNISAEQRRQRLYYAFCTVLICLVAFTFIFPLYWIITGSFKVKSEIISSTPTWWPSEWTMINYQNLMSKRSAPLFDISFGGWNIELFGYIFRFDKYTISGPIVPGALRWLVNTVFMSVTSMLLTCLTAAMAGYALAKKRFYGRTILFSLIVCAMALPKQVILIPLVREMSALKLYDTIWSVIFPIVGWPFGVFLLRQFAEGIPTEMVEACRIDGASEWRTFTDVMFPMIKPGVGACAIFTFVNSWNDYFMQLIMLMSSKELTISVGIATMQGENSTDFGLLMAGSALASVPIIIVFLVFQKYFTKGITMGAVKG
jgi:multiple sugar transport system permease protein